jgi:uncharacterized protein YaiI (UPF0178 family)
VDADASPREVKEIIFRASARLELETILVANHRIPLPLNNPWVRAIRVAGGPDVADAHIVEEASAVDMAVTADIPLAALLVEKGLLVLDPRGEVYSEANIGERLSIRDFMDGLRSSGVDTGGPSAYGEREKRAFANALDRALTERLRQRG